MDDHHHKFLFQPLLPSTITKTPAATATSLDDNDIAHNHKTFVSSNFSILVRLLSIFSVGIISIWANHEASKGFNITILNEDKHSPAGRKFDLFYVSNDRATRIVLNTSKFVENLLYPINDLSKKHVNHVTLRLVACQNLNQMVTIDHFANGHDFVINLSHLVFNQTNIDHAMVAAVQRGMARVWLWDADYRAPESFLAGMVEYVCMLTGFVDVKYSGVAESPKCDHIWWEDKDPRDVAQYLIYFEKHEKGFIQRLNREMKTTWHDQTVDDALGMPAQHLLCPFNSSRHKISSLVGF